LIQPDIPLGLELGIIPEISMDKMDGFPSMLVGKEEEKPSPSLYHIQDSSLSGTGVISFNHLSYLNFQSGAPTKTDKKPVARILITKSWMIH